MNHQVFDTAEQVAEFFKKEPLKKMQGITTDKDGKFHVFYTVSYYRHFGDSDTLEEEDE